MLKPYSYSQLTAWEQCPLKYRLRYIDKMRSLQENIEAFMGKEVHHALQMLYKDVMHSKLPSLDEILERYTERWDADWGDKKERILIVNKDYGPEHLKAMGITCLKHYWNRYYPFDCDTTLGLERKIRAPIDGGHWIEGRIDRLAQRGDIIEIHDYKTSHYLPSQYRLTNELQLGLYSMGVQREWNIQKPISCVWHYLIQDQEMRVAHTQQSIERAKAKALELIGQIESSTEFEPRESLLCDWCEFKSYCPKRKHLAILSEAKPTEYSANAGVRLVNDWVKLWERKEKTVKELEKVEKKILEYAVQNGLENVENESFRIGINWEPSLDLPPKGSDSYEQLVGLLKSSGYWDSFSTLDEYTLERALQKNGRIPKELKEKVLRIAQIKKKGSLTAPRRLSK
jgi:putative RecB family exonuclease